MMVGVALIVAGAVLAFLSLTFFRLIEERQEIGRANV